MKQEKSIYWQLFTSTFYLSAFTFGGGYVIVPLMKKRFVEKLNWISEQEMMNLIAIAQSAPGVLAVNVSILVGHKMAGLKGSLATVMGTILPPFIILSIVSVFYDAFQSNQIIRLLLFGMQAGIAAIIMDVVYTMIKELVSLKQLLPCILLVFAFIANFILSIHIAFILLVAGLVGALYTYKDEFL